MTKAHENQNWKNFPSIDTPVNEQNLNKLDRSVDVMDERILAHEEIKATKEEVAPLVKEISFNESTGVFTITRKNGTSFTIDTLLEKIQTNWDYDPATERIILYMKDGTTQYIDLSKLITQYEFQDSGTIDFSVDDSGKVTAIVIEGSIEEKHLRPNYLADIKVQVAKAETAKSGAESAQEEAKKSQTAAADSASASAKSANASQESAETASSYASAAAASAETATEKASSASTSAANAKASETSAEGSATTSTQKASAASTSAASAASSASTATSKATEASNSAKSASDSATASKSWAQGGTSSRNGEDTDNSKYYYQQSKAIYDKFVSAGDVTGVKGDAEQTYRHGDVNLTPENIGALALTGGTVTGTLTLSKTADADGATDTQPALIVGGTHTTTHIQMDSNEIMAKTNGTTPGTLYLNSSGGLVSIGSGGLSVKGTVTATSFNGKATSATSADSATNADKVDNFHCKPWGGIPVVDSAGVMEIGKYIDFHTSQSDSIDYSTRITAESPGVLSISGTTKGAFSGSLTGNATSASKVANALTFTGGSTAKYDGSSAQSVAIPTITNSLTSTSTTSALSAAQGKTLNDNKLDKTGKAASASTADSATKATQDGSGNNIVNTYAKKTDIPTTLKNPYALSFTGAESGSYDGSVAKTINIPAGVTKSVWFEGNITISSSSLGVCTSSEGGTSYDYVVIETTNNSYILPVSDNGKRVYFVESVNALTSSVTLRTGSFYTSIISGRTKVTIRATAPKLVAISGSKIETRDEEFVVYKVTAYKFN